MRVEGRARLGRGADDLARLQQDCPYCGAEAGTNCRRYSGARHPGGGPASLKVKPFVGYIHKARRDAWALRRLRPR